MAVMLVDGPLFMALFDLDFDFEASIVTFIVETSSTNGGMTFSSGDANLALSSLPRSPTKS